MHNGNSRRRRMIERKGRNILNINKFPQINVRHHTTDPESSETPIGYMPKKLYLTYHFQTTENQR